MVLRPLSPSAATDRIASLAHLGLRHVEIAWQSGERWIGECRELIAAFPDLLLGAASIHSLEGLEAARRAGFTYAVSPLLDAGLLRQAGHDLVLVPGVMTPSEVGQARALGCRLVKLFPAATVGPGHWRRLAAPLGDPLPFCIAAGGLGPADVIPWLQGGVDAVALGSSLSAAAAEAPVSSGGGPSVAADPIRSAPPQRTPPLAADDHAGLRAILSALSR